MQAADNDLIARFQTFANQPFIANRLTGNDRARFHLTFIVNNQHGCITTRCAANALLRDKNGVRLDAFINPCTHKHTRQKRMLRVREDST
ncbi:Uncharacterised protein [Shigella sonnei]|nr:Uncharacterised protein [Shigella sonnei]